MEYLIIVHRFHHKITMSTEDAGMLITNEHMRKMPTVSQALNTNN